MESLVHEEDVPPASGTAPVGSLAKGTAPAESRNPEHGRRALRLGLAACICSVAATAGFLFALSAQPPQTWTLEYFPNTQLEGGAVHAMIGVPDFELSANFPAGPAEGSPRIADSRKVDGDFPRGLPDREGFSVRMRSCVEIPVSGVYRFAVSADDGVRVFVDAQLQIDAWEGQATDGVGKALQLDTGPHSLTIEYVNAKGPARLSIRLSGTDPFQRPRSLRNRTMRMDRDFGCAAP